MRIWRSLVFVLLCATSVAARDLSINPAGVPWLNTNDEWGRAWGDAANQFYKNLEAHRNVHGGDRMQFAVGTEIALRKVFRPKVWFKGNFSGSVSITAARGEYEAFQLVICPITDEERGLGYLSDGRAQGNGSLVPKTVVIHAIDVSPLHHADVDYQIESAASTLYRVGYIPTQPGQYPVMHVGDWPDPLLPLGPLEVGNPYCQPVWVEIRVPREAPAGEYSGHVTVHGPHDVRIEIELTVWDFTLPDPPRTVSNGWVLHEWFRRDGTDRLLERLDVLLDHRLIAWHTAVDTRGDLEAHDRVMELLLSRGVRLQAIGGKPDAAYIEHLHSRGWLEHFVSLWGDEPHERDYPRYRERSDVIHNEFPGLAVAMTEEPTPTNVGLFDVWIAEPSAQRDRVGAGRLESRRSRLVGTSASCPSTLSTPARSTAPPAWSWTDPPSITASPTGSRSSNTSKGCPTGLFRSGLKVGTNGTGAPSRGLPTRASRSPTAASTTPTDSSATPDPTACPGLRFV